MTYDDTIFLTFLWFYVGPVAVAILFTVALVWLFKRAVRALRRKRR